MKMLLVVFVIIAVLADAMASGITLMAFFQASNLLAQVLVFAGGLIITGLVTLTKLIFASGSIMFILVWLVAVAIDAYTTFVGVAYYAIMQMPLSTPVELSMITYDPSNWPRTILIFGVTGIITGTAIVGLWALETELQ